MEVISVKRLFCQTKLFAKLLPTNVPRKHVSVIFVHEFLLWMHVATLEQLVHSCLEA